MSSVLAETRNLRTLLSLFLCRSGGIHMTEQEERTMRSKLILAVVALTASVLPFGAGIAHATPADVLVSVGSPTTPFPQSWQSTPAVAGDPAHRGVVGGPAMDTLDAAACSAWDDPTFCPFGRVGFDGVYFSF